MFAFLNVGANYGLASRPYQSAQSHKALPTWTRGALSPQKCHKKTKKVDILRVGDSKQLTAEVDKFVKHRYTMEFNSINRNLAYDKMQQKLYLYKMNRQKRQLEGQLLKIRHAYQSQMRLHMQRPTNHNVCECRKGVCN